MSRRHFETLTLKLRDLAKEEIIYLEKWVLLAVLIGIVSGVGAVIFSYMIHFATALFLEGLAGYEPPWPGSPRVEFKLPDNRFLLLIPPVLGGLLSGFLVFRYAPEAEGHGTDAAIDAFHYNEGIIRPRVPIIKLIASAITIGSGGSAGKEGPVAQIGGGFGSLLGQILKLSPHDKRIALAVGLGSGIGAIFKAPLGGAIFAAEVLYIMDFEPEVLPAAFIASFVGYLIVGYCTGWSHVFYVPALGSASYKLYAFPSMFFFALLGILNGLLGVVYIKAFYGVKDLFGRLRVPAIIKPAIGGLLTGLIGVFYPEVLGSSYGWLQLAINGDFEKMPLPSLIMLIPLKILATAFSIGSGGSGGVFAPALVIGGSTGAVVWHLAKSILGDYDIPPAAFVIIGMMSFFAGVGKVPIATILMVSEMTGEYELFAPALLSITLAYIVTGKHTIYKSQTFSRNESPAHGGSKIGLLRLLYEELERMKKNILDEVKAEDLMVEARAVLTCKSKVKDAIEIVRKYPYRVYPVVDEGKFVGFVKLEDLITLDPKSYDLDIMFLPLHRGVSVLKNESLRSVLEKMLENELDKAAVIDEDGRLVGIITAKEILRYVALRGIKVELKKAHL